MAQNNIDPQGLVAIYLNNGIQQQPQHGDMIAIRMTSGPWGPGDRWARIEINLQDPQGMPLVQPTWEFAIGPADPLQDYLITGPLNHLLPVFDQLTYAGGPERHGPYHDGRLQMGDGMSEGFYPITENEILNVGTLAMARNELRVLVEVVNRLQRMGAPMPVAPPVQPPPGAIVPQIPVAIPINHIRAVIGNTPTQPRQIPLWLGRAVPAIEGVFPIPDENTRIRVINALLAGQSGLVLENGQAPTWNAAIALLFTRTHGTQAAHMLHDTLREINNAEGIIVAFNMGMMFTNGDFDTVWGILRGFLPGQAVVTNAQHQLDLLPNDAARANGFTQIILNLYQLLGLNMHGQSIRPSVRPRAQPPQNIRQRGRGGFQGRGRGQNRQQFQARQPSDNNQNTQRSASQPQTFRREDGGRQSSQPSRDQRIYQPSGNDSCQPRYNLRRNPQQPDRYGQNQRGPNPYRGNQGTRSGGSSDSFNRGDKGAPGGQGRPEKAVHRVETVVPTAPPEEQHVTPQESTKATKSGDKRQ